MELLNKIINDEKGFNWDGYKFQSDLPNPPVLNPKSREYLIACDELKKLETSLRTSTQEEKVLIIRRMQGHYHQPNMSEALMMEVAKDYVRLLDGYPAKIMQDAVDTFLLDREQKFFPKVGEIKDRIESLLHKAKRRYFKLSLLVNSEKQEERPCV